MADRMDEKTNENESQEQRPEKRWKDLSEKVEQTAKERDEASKAKEEAEVKAAAAQKEAEFYKGFSAVSSKHPEASEYQEQILEKVNTGYSIEDATTTVLIKEGKYNAPAVQRESPAGGSATTAMKSGGEKELSEMTRDEKRAALEQIESEEGGVTRILRRGL